MCLFLKHTRGVYKYVEVIRSTSNLADPYTVEACFVIVFSVDS